MKILLLKALLLLLIIYVISCIFLYCFQEKLIFFPTKLNKDYTFTFRQPFEELHIPTNDGKLLDGLLFQSKQSKGLIFYLHGNAGALNSWGDVAARYTRLHYDVFIPDYRGYGKSEGKIESKAQLLNDVQTAYNIIKERYKESNIIVLGYSIGTGPAAWLAAFNHPKLLILQAPYYSLTDLMWHLYPIIPTVLLKYNFQTAEYLQHCRMPVVIFHGDKDEVIYYGSSVKLKAVMKSTDTLITLHGQGHNGITENLQYLGAINKILH